MAWPFSGNVYGTVQSQPQELAMLVSSFTLVNKMPSAINVNVYKITKTGNELSMMPFGKSINQQEMYQGTNPFVLLPTETIKVQTTGSCDYDFYIENLEINQIQS